jgi:hypothetical protein
VMIVDFYGDIRSNSPRLVAEPFRVDGLAG